MEITQQADYAVRAVLDLAQQTEGARVTSVEISRRQDIPPAFLAKILARLAATGIVTTRRGIHGGVRLARPAKDITLLDVIEVIDGPITLNRCVRHPAECSRERTCVVHPIWMDVSHGLRTLLNGYSFDVIARQVRETSPPNQNFINLSEELPIRQIAEA